MLGETLPPWLLPAWSSLLAKAEAGTLAHAYIVDGARGLGKLAFARRLAATLSCLEPTAQGGCGHCKSCALNASDTHPDVMLLAPKEPGKGLTIDLIRSLGNYAQRSSHAGGARVAVLAEAHTMNINAANALLKTLEEPQQATYLFLVTDQPGLLSPTIRSRCQKISIPRPNESDALAWLQHAATKGIDKQKALECLKAAGGGPLFALELMEGDTLTLRARVDDAFAEVLSGRAQPEDLLAALSALEPIHAAEQLLSAAAAQAKRLLLANQDDSESEAAEARAIQAGRVLKLAEECELARRQLASASNPNPRLVLESLSWLTSRALRQGA